MGKRGYKARPEMERFWSFTRKQGACLIWTGHIGKRNGYGYFSASAPGTKRRARTVSAHRFLYERVFGPLSKHLDAMHSCDNRACVALQHLSPGTRKANMADAQNKKRLGRKLDEDKVREIRARCASGESQKALAKEFGVKTPLISAIHRRIVWKHVK